MRIRTHIRIALACFALFISVAIRLLFHPIQIPPTTEQSIETILDDYHGRAILMEFVEDENIAHLAIGGYLTSGTDTGSRDFAQMVWRIAQIDSAIVTQVYGAFIPSAVNPITYENAAFLIHD